MSYTINPPYASTGAGSAIIPEFWIPKLGKAIATYALWQRFASPVVLDVPLIQRGAGRYVHWSHTTELDPSTTALTAGTNITAGTNTLINGVGTVKEFGNAMELEGFPMWLSDPAYQALANTPQAKQGMDAMASLLIAIATHGPQRTPPYIKPQSAVRGDYFLAFARTSSRRFMTLWQLPVQPGVPSASWSWR